MKKTVIILGVIAAERAFTYTIVMKKFNEIRLANRKRLCEVQQNSFTAGWESGRIIGHVEGRRETLDKLNQNEA